MQSLAVDIERGKAQDKAILKGKFYRITILTERLVRFEYNSSGIFEDRPTQLVQNRNFDVPPFMVKEDETFLEITTKYFKINYTKEKKFAGNTFVPGGNVTVSVNDPDNPNIWYFNHPEVRNFGASNISIDGMDKNIKLEKGLYSDDGFASIDDSNSLAINADGTVSKRSIEGTDLYLFVYNKEFSLALKDYYMLTGNPTLIPRYALGNWWSKNYSYSEEEFFKLFNKFLRNEIPISILLLEKDWHIRNIGDKKNLNTGFTFNKDLIPSPIDFVKRMHVLGVRTGLMVNPSGGILPHEEQFQVASSFMQNPLTNPITFNPYNMKFMEMYLEIMINNLDKMGIDFYWNDYYDKKDLRALWILNHYHYLHAGRDESRRAMLLSRNSLIAGHRYGVLYSGLTKVNWTTLKNLPFYNSSSANIGISWWSHSIGGYHTGIEDGELYLRYVQLGTFSPILRIHSDRSKYYKREPWKWDVQTFEIIKDYMQLRHRLIPYIYTEAYKYHKEGTPLIQPLYYKFKEIYDEPLYKNEYYFGSELLISPLTDKKDIVMDRVVHKFYLPTGTWYDFKTGKRFNGNRSYVSFFRDQDYPVFAKSGSIITLSNDKGNNTNPPTNLEIHIFPGNSNNYRLYEDDGSTNLYQSGYYLITSIDYNYQASNYTVIVRALEGKSGIVPKERNYKIRFRNTKETPDVVAFFNDKQLPTKCYVDENDFIVEVNNVPTIGQLAVNCRGKAIEIDAVRLINEDIDGIISDLPIETNLKEVIAGILFGELLINKKRIEIRKLRRRGLESKFIKMFIRLLEYIENIH